MIRNKNVIEYLEKYYLFFPFGICLFLQLLTLGIEKLTGYVLRSLPHMLLIWLGILSALLLILVLSKVFFEWGYKRKFRMFSIIKKIWYVLVGIMGMAAILVSLFISVFTYIPEHIVEHNGARMVACVNSFLQEQVYYYEYKNMLFFGSEELGYENYGNGGRNPLEDENREPIYEHFNKQDRSQKRFAPYTLYNLQSLIHFSGNLFHSKLRYMSSHFKENSKMQSSELIMKK